LPTCQGGVRVAEDGSTVVHPLCPHVKVEWECRKMEAMLYMPEMKQVSFKYC